MASATNEAVRTWIIPDTPGGLHSNQNWHAIASTPGGDIIVAGMDHVTNSAFFRIAAGSDKLEFIGDVRIFGHVHYLDPSTGKFGERPDWKTCRGACHRDGTVERGSHPLLPRR